MQESSMFSSAILAAMVAPALALSPVHATAHHPAHHKPSSGVAIVNCLGKPVTKPREFMIACADGGNDLTKLTWVHWSQGFALASGTQVANDCVPNCATGKFHDFPVWVIFWGGQQRFQHITLWYPGKTPSGVQNKHITFDAWK
jgi:hypothetical protein